MASDRVQVEWEKDEEKGDIDSKASLSIWKNIDPVFQGRIKMIEQPNFGKLVI